MKISRKWLLLIFISLFPSLRVQIDAKLQLDTFHVRILRAWKWQERYCDIWAAKIWFLVILIEWCNKLAILCGFLPHCEGLALCSRVHDWVLTNLRWNAHISILSRGNNVSVWTECLASQLLMLLSELWISWLRSNLHWSPIPMFLSEVSIFSTD